MKFQPIWKEQKHEINKSQQCTHQQTQNKPSMFKRFLKRKEKESK